VVSVSRTRPANAEERWIEADLGDIASLVRVVEQAAELAPGPFDGVIMNAALADKSASQWTPEQVERHLRINAVSPFTLWSRMEEAALWSWMRSYTMNQPGNHPVSMNMVWPGRVDTPANPPRDLPPEDPNLFYPASRVADVVLGLLYQAPGGPRGTVIDMGRS
jgi:NAD(P)-dependent dehydrogenase (short-subunit alcohol dehydrogenase family)